MKRIANIKPLDLISIASILFAILGLIFALTKLNPAAITFASLGFVCGLACLILKKKLSLNSFWVSWGFAFGVAIAIFAFVFIGGTALVNYLTNSF